MDPCRRRDPEQSRTIEYLQEMLRQPETGAVSSDHAQLFRLFPQLQETGFVRSIVATTAKGEHGPIFAVTLDVREAKGGVSAFLGFASAPCPEGELALLSPPVPLGLPDATIDRAERVPFAGAALTELQIEGGDPPSMLGGKPRRTPLRRSFLVGHGSGALVVAAPKGAPYGVIGSLDALDVDLPPEDGIRRRDVHLFGSGWYTVTGGAAYLLVHHTVHDPRDLCAAKKSHQVSPPQLRLVARIDTQHGFTTEPARVGTAFVIAFGTNQPPEGLSADSSKTLRTGPTVIATEGFEQGPPAQWLYGLFESAEEARSRVRSMKSGWTIHATEPPPDRPAPKEPFTINARRRPPSISECALESSY
jgi:hypothetical protein